ncbi:MAG: amino acid adenylation domain-containing protein [Ktedonobacteraceae bacterium]
MRNSWAFELLLKELQPKRIGDRNPLFQVMFVLQNVPISPFDLPDLTVELQDVPNGAAKFDLSLNMTVTGRGLACTFEYNSDLFDAETISRLVEHFHILLRGIVSHVEQRLSHLPFLTVTEQYQLLHTWSTSRTVPQRQTSFLQIFEAQGERFPDAIAVVCSDSQLTYRELNRLSNQLAHYLVRRGITLEARVGICAERSVEMIIAILSVLKAGGAYVPLDSKYPRHRLDYILRDSAISIVLTCFQPNLFTDRSERHVVLALEDVWEAVLQEQEEDLAPRNMADSLAYIIYTSGSTGEPKGVLIAHRGLANLVEEQGLAFNITPGSRVLQFASLSFDASVSEICVTLGAGATLCLEKQDLLLSGRSLIDFLSKQAITTLTIPPAVLVALPPEPLPKLRTIIVAGEACTIDSIAPWAKDHEILNGYGLTEGTVCTTIGRYQPHHRNLPIGRPIGNAQVYIVDRFLQLAPIGVPGELLIGGSGLARGYLGRPELTAERFLPHPFSEMPGERLYRTGDLARYLLTGEIEFLGRIDRQVKLRGLRIELGEIETVLKDVAAIQDAVVVVREDEARNPYLVAYIVVRQGMASTPHELSTYLRTRLPTYMVPAIFVALDVFPLQIQGKIDYRLLPEPIRQCRKEQKNVVTTAEDPVEAILLAIWAEVLGLEQIGRDDDFFEYGGHSLLATQVISRVGVHFRVELPIRTLFEAPTVAAFARRVVQARWGENERHIPLLPRSKREVQVALSFAQERLWFLHQLVPDSPAYHIPATFLLKGQLRIALLEDCLFQIIQRHETLRTSFLVEDGQPIQDTAPKVTVPFPIIDLSDVPAPSDVKMRRLITVEARQPFLLRKAPLLRAALLILGRDEYVFVFTMHHIVSDGWSVGVFMRELGSLYEASLSGKPSSLPELRLQYTDYASWQRQWMKGKRVEKLLSYWRRQLAGAPTVLHMPTDHPRSSLSIGEGAIYTFALSKSFTQEIKIFCQQEGATLFMVLLAAFAILISQRSGQDDILIGSPIANRNRVEIENLIGFFVNSLVLRTNLSGDPSVRQILGQVREMTLEAYAHQDLPFELLVQELKLKREVSRNPLFQIALTLQNAPAPPPSFANVQLTPLLIDLGFVKLDLSLSWIELDEELVGMLEYNANLFEMRTVQHLTEDLKTVLRFLIAQPDAALSALAWSLSVEMRQKRRVPAMISDKSTFQKLRETRRKAISFPTREGSEK